jgi:hypothetical protein
MNKWILATLLAVVSGSAAAEWVEAGVSSGGTVTAYADPATIRKEGKLVTMSVLFDYKTVQAGDGKPYLSATVQSEYDCEEALWRTPNASMHSGNMGKGEIVNSASYTGKGMEVPSNTPLETLWKIACGKQ